MISQLEGKVSYTDLRYIILDVGGVGYKINVALDTLEKITRLESEKIRFWTYLAVRENALDLYGFLDQEGLQFFEKLITISGIGPKTAMGILSVATVSTLRRAIASGDSSPLTKISGIGKKNAEKIVLELKDKIFATDEEKDGEPIGESDALEALETLGYSQKEARDALKKIGKEITNTGERVKQALKILGSK